MKTMRFAAVAMFAALLTIPAAAKSLKIGVTPGAYADSIQAAAEEAKAKGLDVEVVEFSDWTTPNVALAAGDIDVNYFQHRPFLDNAIKDRGYDFTDVGVGALANIGLYSLKHKSFAEVPEGGKVAIANDPVNQGRGLLLLEKAGLIKLKEGVGFHGTLDDIVENPKKLSFTERSPRPGSTASTSPTPSRRRASRTSPSSSSPNFSGAADSSAPTRRGRCEKNCPARGRSFRAGIRPPHSATTRRRR
ncbi:MetQ/NlpA family ABC transporter substrate-binding protein [Chelatococcus sambhunathii]|uniref:MetQ/NlpA family ABC transporter substrate-binding protein n=1 Tax=Chelatococcus sambhunathii TaxID=363953 RepID=UPI0028527F0D|nr:MetQ/NlpA family ABC transporter substrate-binding protein [Chelatococcus sambhunathii]